MVRSDDPGGHPTLMILWKVLKMEALFPKHVSFHNVLKESQTNEYHYYIKLQLNKKI